MAGRWAGAVLALVLLAGSWPRAGVAAQPVRPAAVAAAFADADHGWIGGDGAIFATADGGTTWSRQYVGPASIRRFAFVSPAVGWALADDALLGTTDGGATWTPLADASTPLLAVDRVDAQAGWGVLRAPGGGVPAGGLARTADGGRTWETMPSPGAVQSVCFVDAARGFAAGRGTVWLTEDAGRGWREVLVSPVVADRLAGGGDASSLSAEVRCAGGAAWALFHGPGAMMHASYALYRSADLGATWRPVVQSNQFPVTGAAYGYGSDAAALSAVDAATAYTAQACWPCSLPGRDADQGTVALGATLDGGRTWRDSPPVPDLTGPAAIRGPYALAASGVGRVWLVAADARAARVTADGGATWRTVPMPE